MATVDRSWWERSRGWVLGFLIGAILGAIGAGFVYVRGREELAALDTAHGARTLEASRSTAEVRAALDAARSTEALLQARIAASAALDEVDRSNFGLARDRLSTVATGLSQVDPVLAGVDPAALENARQVVQNALNEVAPDAATLRQRLLEVEHVIDDLLPREQQG